MNQKILKFSTLIFAALIFISLCSVFLKPIEDLDFFWHLATGRWIIEHLALPADDPFNYTTPATPHPRKQFILTSYWLSQIIYYGIYYIAGWNGFIFLRFVIVVAIICFIYKRARDSNKIIFFSLMTIAMIVFAQIYAVERPQIFSFLFFAILLYLLDEMKRNSRAEDQQSSSVTERQSDRATVASADSPPPQADHRFMVRQAHHDKPCHPEPVEGHLFTYCSLPLLMLLWANMHAGFIVGQGIILIYLLSEGLKFIHPSFNPMDRSSYVKFLIIGISAILAAFINPNAYSAVTEMWRTSKFVSTGLTITEHRSTIALFKDYYPLYIPVYWLLLSIASISLLFRVIKKRLDIQDIFMLAGFGYFSFTQLRYVAFFLIWAVPFISNTTTVPCPTGARTERRGLMYAYLLLSLSVITFLVIGQGEYKFLKNTAGFKNGRWISRYFPEAAVRFIVKNNIKGNMYNYYDWGGYLIWGFYPGKKVAVDGRNLYEVQYIRDTAVLTAASRPVVNGMPYYKAILESYGIRYMVIPLFGIDGVMFPIVAEMIKDKEWIPVFMSDNSMIFVKNTLENYAVVHTYSIPKDIFVVYLFRMLDNAIKGTPKNFFLYLAKADLYYSQSRFKEAKEEYEKVLKINPFNTFARKKLESIDGFIR